MLHVDIPTIPEIKSLVSQRADACLSIYLPTTPQTQHVAAARIALGNLAKQALDQLDAAGFDKRRRAALAEQIELLREDDEFWQTQANSLVVLATPDSIRTYRLPNRLSEEVQVSDRFYLKPLLRAVTFPHHAFVLALASGGARLVEVFSDLPAVELRVPDMPHDAASAAGRASINERSPSGRIQGSEGHRVRLAQFARKLDAALRPVFAGRHEALILAATEPMLSLYRAANTYPGLAATAIVTSPETMTPAQLADAARPILDGLHAEELAALRATFATRANQGRVTTDVAIAARAATMGAVETLLVDIDEVVPGTVDEETGAVVFASAAGPSTYGIVDEIAGRALSNGARVLGVRKADIPGGASLAAIFRYPIG